MKRYQLACILNAPQTKKLTEMMNKLLELDDKEVKLMALKIISNLKPAK